MSRIYKYKHKRSGFTLIEVMLALGILAVLSTIGFLNLSSFLGSRYARTGLEETSSVLLEARTRATTGQEGRAWGVRISSLENPRRYELFSGSSYDPLAVEQTYFLARGVKFSEPSTGGVFDALFQPVSGSLLSAKVLSLHGGGGGILGDVILHAPGFLTTRLESDVLGYWHLDQSLGSVAPDASPSSFHGVVSGALWQGSSECRAGGCLYFDGSSDNVSGAFSRSLSSFSILGWVRLQGGGGNKGALWSGYEGSTGRVYARILGSSRKPSFYTDPPGGVEGATAASTALSLDAWHHLAYVYDGVSKKIYIDGVENVSENAPGLSFSLDSFEIGRSEKDPLNVLQGFLDEVRVYGRALTPEEVLDRYNDLR